MYLPPTEPGLAISGHRKFQSPTSDVDLLALPSLLLVERRQLPSLSAVYFVLDGVRVLDIGKSTNLAQKWKAYRGLR